MGGENNRLFFFFLWDSITVLTFLLFYPKKKKIKQKGYVISEFVWGYFGTPKIEDETKKTSY